MCSRISIEFLETQRNPCHERNITLRSSHSSKIYKCTDKRIYSQKGVCVETADFLEREGLNEKKNYTETEATGGERYE